MSHLELVLESKARCMTAGCVLCEPCCGYHTLYIVVPKWFMLHFSIACSAQNAHTHHQLHFSSSFCTLNPQRTSSLEAPCIPPEWHTLVQAARHRSAAAAHLTPHIHTVPCCPPPRDLSVSRYASDGARLSFRCPHAHATPRSRGEGGEGASARGRSHALAEEDGRERVVFADGIHVTSGLVGRIAQLVPMVIRITIVIGPAVGSLEIVG